MHSGRDGDWKQLADYGSRSVTCEQVRESNVARDVLSEIGGALADQPTDNPIRQQAYGRAERRIRERYRCEWSGS
jgi:hypothetical protein